MRPVIVVGEPLPPRSGSARCTKLRSMSYRICTSVARRRRLGNDPPRRRHHRRAPLGRGLEAASVARIALLSVPALQPGALTVRTCAHRRRRRRRKRRDHRSQQRKDNCQLKWACPQRASTFVNCRTFHEGTPINGTDHARHRPLGAGTPPAGTAASLAAQPLPDRRRQEVRDGHHRRWPPWLRRGAHDRQPPHLRGPDTSP